MQALLFFSSKVLYIPFFCSTFAAETLKQTYQVSLFVCITPNKL